MRNFLLIFMLICSINLYGQTNLSKVDIRFGMGLSLLGSGDIIVKNYENEINYKINNYLTSSLSLNIGTGKSGIYNIVYFTQTNLNLYLSMFKNNKKNDFRIGGGFTYYSINEMILVSSYWRDGILIDRDYKDDERKSIGFNVIIENTYSITKKILVGVKIITQPYFNGDINTGWFIKTGIKI